MKSEFTLCWFFHWILSTLKISPGDPPKMWHLDQVRRPILTSSILVCQSMGQICRLRPGLWNEADVPEAARYVPIANFHSQLCSRVSRPLKPMTSVGPAQWIIWRCSGTKGAGKSLVDVYLYLNPQLPLWGMNLSFCITSPDTSPVTWPMCFLAGLLNLRRWDRLRRHLKSWTIWCPDLSDCSEKSRQGKKQEEDMEGELRTRSWGKEFEQKGKGERRGYRRWRRELEASQMC